MSADKQQPESVFDNDREARALALKLAVDAAASLPARVRDAFGDQSADVLSAQILADAKAFATFIKHGRVPRSVEKAPTATPSIEPEEPTDV